MIGLDWGGADDDGPEQAKSVATGRVALRTTTTMTTTTIMAMSDT